MANDGVRVPVVLEWNQAIQDSIAQARRIPPVNVRVNTGRIGDGFKHASKEAEQFERALASAQTRVLTLGASFGALFAIQRGFKALIQTTIDVEKQLKDINVILGVSTSSLSTFSEQLFGIAKNTGQSFETVAKAALEFSRQGLGVQETLKRTNDALILTRQTGLDAAEATDAITAAINSFSQAALTSSDIVNKFAKVDQNFAVSSADLAEAIKRVGSSAEEAGVGIDELIALVTSAQQITQRGGAVIGNAFKTIFTRTARPQVLNDLEQLGITVRNAQGDILPAVQILTNLANSYDNLSQAQQSAAAELVGSVYQINILKASLKDLGKEHSFYSKALNDSSTATDEAVQRNEALNTTLAALINRTKENVRQFSANVGQDTFGPSIRRVAGLANGFLENANNILGADKAEVAFKEIGSVLGKGLVRGFGQFLQGPGLALIGVALFKFASQFARLATEAYKLLTDLNKSTDQRAAIESRVLGVLRQEPNIYSQILGNSLSVVQAQEKVLQIITAQNAALNAQKAIASQLTSTLINTGAVGVNPKTREVVTNPALKKTRSEGSIPNFAVNILDAQKEIEGAYKAKYIPGQVRQVGDAVINNAESIKTSAAHPQEKAIVPPQGSEAGQKYKEAYRTIYGKSPYGDAITKGRNAFQVQWMKSIGAKRGLDLTNPDNILVLAKQFRETYGSQQGLLPFNKGKVPSFASSLTLSTSKNFVKLAKERGVKIVREDQRVPQGSAFYIRSGAEGKKIVLPKKTPIDVLAHEVGHDLSYDYLNIYSPRLLKEQSANIEALKRIPTEKERQGYRETLSPATKTYKIGILRGILKDFAPNIDDESIFINELRKQEGKHSDRYSPVIRAHSTALRALIKDIGPKKVKEILSQLPEIDKTDLKRKPYASGHVPNFNLFSKVSTEDEANRMVKVSSVNALKPYLKKSEGDVPNFASGRVPNFASSLSLSTSKKLLREAKKTGIKTLRTNEPIPYYDIPSSSVRAPKGTSFDVIAHELGHGFSYQENPLLERVRSDIKSEVGANTEILNRLSGKEKKSFAKQMLNPFKTYKITSLVDSLRGLVPLPEMVKIIGQHRIRTKDLGKRAGDLGNYSDFRKSQSQVLRDIVKTVGPQKVKERISNLSPVNKQDLKARYFASGRVPNLAKSSYSLVHSTTPQLAKTIESEGLKPRRKEGFEKGYFSQHVTNFEKLAEEVRASEFPDLPSRLNSVYLTPESRKFNRFGTHFKVAPNKESYIFNLKKIDKAFDLAGPYGTSTVPNTKLRELAREYFQSGIPLNRQNLNKVLEKEKENTGYDYGDNPFFEILTPGPVSAKKIKRLNSKGAVPNFNIDVNGIFSQLPERERVVIEEHADGLKLGEIAKKYNISRNKASSIFNRGRNSFIKQYGLAKKGFGEFAAQGKIPNFAKIYKLRTGFPEHILKQIQSLHGKQLRIFPTKDHFPKELRNDIIKYGENNIPKFDPNLIIDSNEIIEVEHDDNIRGLHGTNIEKIVVKKTTPYLDQHLAIAKDGGIKSIWHTLNPDRFNKPQNPRNRIYSQGQVPNFASSFSNISLAKAPHNSTAIRRLGIPKTGSYASYYFDRNKHINISFIESNQKGDAFRLFKALGRTARRIKRPIISETLVKSSKQPDENQTNWEQLLVRYPQLRYRDLPNASTNGVFRPNLLGSEERSFNTFEELKTIVNQVPSDIFKKNLRTGFTSVGNLSTTFKNKGQAPNFAYIPFISPLVGRVVTNLVHSGEGFSMAALKPAFNFAKEKGIKQTIKNIILDKPAHQGTFFGFNEEGREDFGLSEFGFRKMFGLEPRIPPNPEVKLRQIPGKKNTYAIGGRNPLQNFGVNLTTKTPQNVRYRPQDPNTIRSLFRSPDFGAFNLDANTKNRKIRYSDTWDFALHGSEKLNFKELKDELKRRFIRQPELESIKDEFKLNVLPKVLKQNPLKTIKDIKELFPKNRLKSVLNPANLVFQGNAGASLFTNEPVHSYGSSQLTKLFRKLVNSVSSPATFVGQVTNPDDKKLLFDSLTDLANSDIDLQKTKATPAAKFLGTKYKQNKLKESFITLQDRLYNRFNFNPSSKRDFSNRKDAFPIGKPGINIFSAIEKYGRAKGEVPNFASSLPLSTAKELLALAKERKIRITRDKELGAFHRFSERRINLPKGESIETFAHELGHSLSTDNFYKFANANRIEREVMANQEIVQRLVDPKEQETFKTNTLESFKSYKSGIILERVWPQLQIPEEKRNQYIEIQQKEFKKTQRSKGISPEHRSSAAVLRKLVKDFGPKTIKQLISSTPRDEREALKLRYSFGKIPSFAVMSPQEKAFKDIALRLNSEKHIGYGPQKYFLPFLSDKTVNPYQSLYYSTPYEQQQTKKEEVEKKLINFIPEGKNFLRPYNNILQQAPAVKDAYRFVRNLFGDFAGRGSGDPLERSANNYLKIMRGLQKTGVFKEINKLSPQQLLRGGIKSGNLSLYGFGGDPLPESKFKTRALESGNRDLVANDPLYSFHQRFESKKEELKLRKQFKAFTSSFVNSVSKFRNIPRIKNKLEEITGGDHTRLALTAKKYIPPEIYERLAYLSKTFVNTKRQAYNLGVDIDSPFYFRGQSRSEAAILDKLKEFTSLGFASQTDRLGVTLNNNPLFAAAFGVTSGKEFGKPGLLGIYRKKQIDSREPRRLGENISSGRLRIDDLFGFIDLAAQKFVPASSLSKVYGPEHAPSSEILEKTKSLLSKEDYDIIKSQSLHKDYNPNTQLTLTRGLDVRRGKKISDYRGPSQTNPNLGELSFKELLDYLKHSIDTTQPGVIPTGGPESSFANVSSDAILVKNRKTAKELENKPVQKEGQAHFQRLVSQSELFGYDRLQNLFDNPNLSTERKNKLLRSGIVVNLPEIRGQIGYRTAAPEREYPILTSTPKTSGPVNIGRLFAVSPYIFKKSGYSKGKLPNFAKAPQFSQLQLKEILGGSTEARKAVFQDSQFVLKYGKSSGHAINEFVSNRLFNAFGENVPEAQLIDTPQGKAFLSKFIQSQSFGELYDKGDINTRQRLIQGVKPSFAAHAAFANWDAFGDWNPAGANVRLDSNNRQFFVDLGGALAYRGLGAPKPNFGPEVPELRSLIDYASNPYAKAAFKFQPEELKSNVADFLKRTPSNLSGLLESLNSETQGDPHITKALKQIPNRLNYLRNFIKSKGSIPNFAFFSGIASVAQSLTGAKKLPKQNIRANITPEEMEAIYFNYAKTIYNPQKGKIPVGLNYFANKAFNSAMFEHQGSYVFGSHDNELFLPTHFAPKSLKGGFAAQKALSEYSNVMYAVTQEMTPMLERLGFSVAKSGVKVPFRGGTALKDFLVSDKLRTPMFLTNFLSQMKQGAGSKYVKQYLTREDQAKFSHYYPYGGGTPGEDEAIEYLRNRGITANQGKIPSSNAYLKAKLTHVPNFALLDSLRSLIDVQNNKFLGSKLPNTLGEIYPVIRDQFPKIGPILKGINPRLLLDDINVDSGTLYRGFARAVRSKTYDGPFRAYDSPIKPSETVTGELDFLYNFTHALNRGQPLKFQKASLEALFQIGAQAKQEGITDKVGINTNSDPFFRNLGNPQQHRDFARNFLNLDKSKPNQSFIQKYVNKIFDRNNIDADENHISKNIDVGNNTLRLYIEKERGDIRFSSNGSFHSLTGAGAFSTMKALTPALRIMLWGASKLNPNLKFNFKGVYGDEKTAYTRQKLYLRQLKKAGIPFEGGVHDTAYFSFPKGSSYKNKGNIPNFADPLIEAVNREIAAGVNPKLIKVGRHPNLRSSENPLGLGVYNKRDEPSGLYQGISRAIREGMNPRTYGMKFKGKLPNFAPKGAGAERVLQEASINEGSINTIMARFRELSSAIANSTIPLSQLSAAAQTVAATMQSLSKGLGLTEEQTKRFSQSIGDSLKRTVSDEQNRRKAAAEPIYSSVDISDRKRVNAARRAEERAKKRAEEEGYLIRQAEASENRREQRRLGNKAVIYPSGTTTENTRTRLTQPPLEFRQRTFNPLERQIAREVAAKPFTLALPERALGFARKLGVSDRFLTSSENYNLFRQVSRQAGPEEKQALKGIRDQRNASFINKAFAVSFAAPLVGGVITEAIGQSTPTRRGVGTGVQTLANAASFGAIGAQFGGPYGAAAGAAVGLAFGLIPTFKAFNDTLPDLSKRLEIATEGANRFSEGLNTFISTGEKLKFLYENPTPNLGRDVARLQAQRATSFTLLPIDIQRRLTEAEKKGDTTEIASISQEGQLRNIREVNGLAIAKTLGTAVQEKSTEAMLAGLKSFEAEVLGITNKQGETFAQYLQENRAAFNLLKGQNDENSIDRLNNVIKNFSPNQYQNILPALNQIAAEGTPLRGLFGKNSLKTITNETFDLNKQGAEASLRNVKNANRNLNSFGDAIFKVQERLIDFGGRVNTATTLLVSNLRAASERLEILAEGTLAQRAPFIREENLPLVRAGLNTEVLLEQFNNQRTNIAAASQREIALSISDSLNRFFEGALDLSKSETGEGNKIIDIQKQTQDTTRQLLRIVDQNGPEALNTNFDEISDTLKTQLQSLNIDIQKSGFASKFQNLQQDLLRNVSFSVRRNRTEQGNQESVLRQDIINNAVNDLIKAQQETNSRVQQRNLSLGGGIESILNTNFLSQRRGFAYEENAGRILGRNDIIGANALRQADLLNSFNVEVPQELRNRIGRGAQSNLQRAGISLPQEAIDQMIENRYPREGTDQEIQKVILQTTSLYKALEKQFNDPLKITSQGISELVALAKGTGLRITTQNTPIEDTAAFFDKKTESQTAPTKTVPTQLQDVDSRINTLTKTSLDILNRQGKRTDIINSIQKELNQSEDSHQVRSVSPFAALGRTSGQLTTEPTPAQITAKAILLETKKDFDKNQLRQKDLEKQINELREQKRILEFPQDPINQLLNFFPSQRGKLIEEARTPINTEVLGPILPPELERERLKNEILELAKSFGYLTNVITKFSGRINDISVLPRNRRGAQTLVDTSLGQINENEEPLSRRRLFETAGAAAGFWNSANDTVLEFQKTIIDTAETFRSSFKQAAGDMITGSKSVEEAFREMGLNIGNRFLSNVAGNSVDSLLGLLGQAGGGLGSFFTTKRNTGGLIQKFAKGGRVKGGSGTRDDVPALLDGGEFVITKRAAQAIGYEKLNKLQKRAESGKFNTDGGPSGAPSEVLVGANSVRINLQNAFKYNDAYKPTKGTLAVDPRLSAFALTDDNNPQNQIRVEREAAFYSYLQARKQYHAQKVKTLSEYEERRRVQAGMIVFSAALSGLSGFLNSSGNSGQPASHYSAFDTSPVSRNPSLYRFASGGPVRTPKVPALLTGGEFVFSPAATRNIGLSTLGSMNQVRGYADGGLVSPFGSVTQVGDNRLTDYLSKLIMVSESIREAIGAQKGTPNAKPQKETSQAINNNISISITVNKDGSVKSNVNSENGKKNDGSGNKEEKETEEEKYKRLARMIDGKVMEVLAREQKPGGVLYDLDSR